MTPNKRELTDLRPSNVECTFGNNEKLKAVGCGRAQVETTSEKGDKVKILLNDVLYVPGLPQKMLSTGKLCGSGGEFLQSTRRQSVLIMPDSKTRIPLQRGGEFLWLVPNSQKRNLAVCAQQVMILSVRTLFYRQPQYSSWRVLQLLK